MRPHNKPKKSTMAGATMVEFTLVSTVFLVLLVSILDFGLMLFSMITLQHAAGEGARYGVTGERRLDSEATLATREDSIRRVIEANAVMPRPAPLTITITQKAGSVDVPLSRSSSDSGTQATLSIDVSYPYRPFISNWLGFAGAITLRGHAVMRNEKFPTPPWDSSSDPP